MTTLPYLFILAGYRCAAAGLDPDRRARVTVGETHRPAQSMTWPQGLAVKRCRSMMQMAALLACFLLCGRRAMASHSGGDGRALTAAAVGRWVATLKACMHARWPRRHCKRHMRMCVRACLHACCELGRTDGRRLATLAGSSSSSSSSSASRVPRQFRDGASPWMRRVRYVYAILAASAARAREGATQAARKADMPTT